jgi:hypothetical protein
MPNPFPKAKHLEIRSKPKGKFSNYLVVYRNLFAEPFNEADFLDYYLSEGWELVSVNPRGHMSYDGSIYYFRTIYGDGS